MTAPTSRRLASGFAEDVPAAGEQPHLADPAVPGGAPLGLADGPDRQALLDERTFLLRSLEDLAREWAAGDLDSADYEALRARYTARAAEVLRALAEPTAVRCPPEGTGEADGELPGETGSVPGGGSRVSGPQRRAAPVDRLRVALGRRRRWLVAVAVACFLLAAGVLVAGETGIGLPGNPVTGSLTLTRSQREQRLLAQGEAALLEARSAAALAAFEEVLTIDPNQVEALSEVGWLEFSAGVHARDRGLVRRGQQQEAQAVADAPGQFAPRFYLGAMLAQEGALAQAVAQFEAGLSDHPPSSTVAVFAPTIVKAYTEAHVPVPSVVAADQAADGSAASGGS